MIIWTSYSLTVYMLCTVVVVYACFCVCFHAMAKDKPQDPICTTHCEPPPVLYPLEYKIVFFSSLFYHYSQFCCHIFIIQYKVLLCNERLFFLSLFCVCSVLSSLCSLPNWPLFCIIAVFSPLMCTFQSLPNERSVRKDKKKKKCPTRIELMNKTREAQTFY